MQNLPSGARGPSSPGISHSGGAEIVGDPEQVYYSNGQITQETRLVWIDESWNTLPSTNFPPLNWDQDWGQILPSDLGADGCMPLNWTGTSDLDLTSNAPLKRLDLASKQ